MKAPLSLQKLAEIRSLLSEVRTIGSGQHYEILQRHAMEKIAEKNNYSTTPCLKTKDDDEKIISKSVIKQ